MWKFAVLLSSAALIVMTAPAILLTVTFGGSEVDTVSGMVGYVDGERDLPLGAYVEVVLVDVSGSDALARPLGRQVIEDVTALPVEFRVPYNPDRLTPSSAHELWVAVRHEGNLLYAASSDYPFEPGTTVSGIDLAVGPPMATP